MPDLEPGTVLSGQYRIESKIGRGAVATVYAAWDTELDEDIALKAIPTFGNTEAAKQAVLPEYKAVRRLKSGREHILHIDRPTVCEHSGMDMVLLPMERAEKSFRDWLEATETDPGVEGRLEEGLALLRQACRGVAALHEQGLAHMDLKPENLLLTKGGSEPSEPTEWTVKVADFGLARSLRRGEVLNEEVVAEGVGTPYYMAPEQIWAARQKEVGPEADVYSLGVILFEMLDGDRPFDGTAETVRKKHREMAPPDVYTYVPERLEVLAHECLAKEAGERPQIGDLTQGLSLDHYEPEPEETDSTTDSTTEDSTTEAQPAEPSEATRRKVRRALEQENLQPIEEALQEENTEVRVALEEEAEELSGSQQGALLRQASEEALPEVAQALLEAGADPDATDENGKTPLHRAVKGGAVEIAEVLLDEWADSDPVDKDGWTPLHWAAWLGHPRIAEVLIENNADLKAKTDRYGFVGTPMLEKQTPLHNATFRGNAEVTEILLKAGGDVSERVQGGRREGSTPLHLAVEDGPKSKPSSKVTALLIESGAEVDAATRNGGLSSVGGCTPLHRAASNGYVEGAEVLIQAGAAVDATDAKGRTPLHKAASGGYPEVVEILIEEGAVVDAIGGKEEQTPLHRAADLGHPEVAGVLLDAGAEVNLTTRFRGQTPLDKSDEGSQVARRIRREGGERTEDLGSGFDLKVDI
jgi:ankyrin repeat protein